MIEYKEFSVSEVGQIAVPKDIREAWDIQEGTDRIRQADLEEGLLFIPDGTEWALVEAFYPESELLKRARSLHDQYAKGEIADLELSTEIDVFKPTKVYTSGQISPLVSARNRWDMPRGTVGKTVDIFDLNSGVVVVPSSDDSDMVPGQLVSANLFEKGDWPYNTNGLMTVFLRAGYADWQKGEGKGFRSTMLGGSYSRQPLTETTRLATAMQDFVMDGTMLAAAKIQKESKNADKR